MTTEPTTTTGTDWASLFQPVADDLTGAIMWVVPVALALGGMILGIRKGWSLIRGLSGK